MGGYMLWNGYCCAWPLSKQRGGRKEKIRRGDFSDSRRIAEETFDNSDSASETTQNPVVADGDLLVG